MGGRWQEGARAAAAAGRPYHDAAGCHAAASQLRSGRSLRGSGHRQGNVKKVGQKQTPQRDLPSRPRGPHGRGKRRQSCSYPGWPGPARERQGLPGIQSLMRAALGPYLQINEVAPLEGDVREEVVPVLCLCHQPPPPSLPLPQRRVRRQALPGQTLMLNSSMASQLYTLPVTLMAVMRVCLLKTLKVTGQWYCPSLFLRSARGPSTVAAGCAPPASRQRPSRTCESAGALDPSRWPSRRWPGQCRAS
jgi:hypothetical protein